MKVRFRAPRSRLLAVLALAVAPLTVAACGDDEESSESEDSASVEEVTLTANDENAPEEYTFDLSATPTAETKSVTFTNEGKEPHALVFARINEGYTVDEAYELEGRKGSAELIVEDDAGPGQSKTIQVKKPLEPGEYAMLCPIPGPNGPHYKLGQLEEFTIE